MDDYTHDRLEGPITLTGVPLGIPGVHTTRTYFVSLPWWAAKIRRAAEVVVRWTARFEIHRRIG